MIKLEYYLPLTVINVFGMEELRYTMLKKEL